VTLTEYYERFGTRITQDSERLFVDDFVFPLLGDRIGEIEPQFPFIDSTGRCRRIDFAYKGKDLRPAIESDALPEEFGPRHLASPSRLPETAAPIFRP
jgi:hypothetical protein